MKKWKLDRIISVATLVTSVIALFLVLKKPAPVAEPQAAATAVANAQSFQEKVQQLDEPKEAGQPPAEVRLSSNEVSAALAQAAGQIPLGATTQAMSGLASARKWKRLPIRLSGRNTTRPRLRNSMPTAGRPPSHRFWRSTK